MNVKTLATLTLILIAVVAVAQEKRILTLEECIDIAVENNLSVKRSRLNLTSAQIDLKQSKAQRYPSLNMGGNYGYNWGRAIDPTTNLFVNQRINFNGLSGNSSMPIIQGFQLTNTIKQNRLNVEASEFDVQRTINDISLNIGLLYLNVILNQELLQNAKFQLESSQQQLDQTKKLVASGALPLSDELQLISQVTTNEVNVITAENALDLSLLDLKQQLLLQPGEEIDIVIPDISVDQVGLDEESVMDIYTNAIDNQPEIKSADLRVNSANVGLKVSEGALYPSLSLNGSFSTNYANSVDEIYVLDGSESTIIPSETDLVTTSGEPIIENIEIPGGSLQSYGVIDQWDDNLSRSLSLGLNIPIFNGFNARSNIQRSKISIQQAEITALEERNTLYQAIESAYRNARAASKTYTASEKQVEALEETFRVVENQYGLGAANFTDYQVASNNLFQAKSDLARAKYDFIFREKILAFYRGKPLNLE